MPDDALLTAFNASIVGLLSAATAPAAAPTSAAASTPANDDAAVVRVPWPGPGDYSSGAALLGLGVVCAVDAARRVWYVRTPVVTEQLESVAVFARGPLLLPAALAATTTMDGDGAWAEPCPYASFDFTAAAGEVAGTAQRRPRLNLARKRLLSAGAP